MTLYNLLLFIHITSAILGIGPGLAMVFVTKNARNMTELRYAYLIRKKLHNCVMIGGTLLLLTGLTMGALSPIWFRSGWYVTSLILFLVALGMGPIVLSPRSKKIKALLEHHIGEEIPEEYVQSVKKLFLFEWVENSIILVIIVLMITKPF